LARLAVAVALFDCTNREWAIVFTILPLIFLGFYTPGSITSTQTIAPAYSGTMAALGRVMNGLAGALGAYLVAGFVGEQSTSTEWLAVFITIAVVQVVGGVVYVIFGSVEVQPWAMPPALSTTENKLRRAETAPTDNNDKRSLLQQNSIFDHQHAYSHTDIYEHMIGYDV